MSYLINLCNEDGTRYRNFVYNLSDEYDSYGKEDDSWYEWMKNVAKKHNAIYLPHSRVLVFESEKDASWFLLRWS